MISRSNLILLALCIVGLAMVSADAYDLQASMKQRAADDVCKTCEQVAQYIKDSGVVAKYLGQLKQLCTLCSVPDQCSKALDDWAKTIDTSTPEQVCQKAGLCQKATGNGPLMRWLTGQN